MFPMAFFHNQVSLTIPPFILSDIIVLNSSPSSYWACYSFNSINSIIVNEFISFSISVYHTNC